MKKMDSYSMRMLAGIGKCGYQNQYRRKEMVSEHLCVKQSLETCETITLLCLKTWENSSLKSNLQVKSCLIKLHSNINSNTSCVFTVNKCTGPPGIETKLPC